MSPVWDNYCLDQMTLQRADHFTLPHYVLYSSKHMYTVATGVILATVYVYLLYIN